MKKYHIEENTVQETLVIPLYGRLICSEHFPDLFSDPEAERICASLDYDFEKKMLLSDDIIKRLRPKAVGKRLFHKNLRIYVHLNALSFS